MLEWSQTVNLTVPVGERSSNSKIVLKDVTELIIKFDQLYPYWYVIYDDDNDGLYLLDSENGKRTPSVNIPWEELVRKVTGLQVDGNKDKPVSQSPLEPPGRNK